MLDHQRQSVLCCGLVPTRYKSRFPRKWLLRLLLHLCHLHPEAKGKGRRRQSSSENSNRSADVSSRTTVWRSFLPRFGLVRVVQLLVVVELEGKNADGREKLVRV